MWQLGQFFQIQSHMYVYKGPTLKSARDGLQIVQEVIK